MRLKNAWERRQQVIPWTATLIFAVVFVAHSPSSRVHAPIRRDFPGVSQWVHISQLGHRYRNRNKINNRRKKNRDLFVVYSPKRSGCIVQCYFHSVHLTRNHVYFYYLGQRWHTFGPVCLFYVCLPELHKTHWTVFHDTCGKSVAWTKL